MNERIVYLMRGLPSCGKSHTARKLAGDTGVICETDQFFYTQVGDDATKYNYDETLLPQARDWNFERFKDAIDTNRSPIVVDRGNGRNAETQRYARYAIEHGYHVELREPESPWWREIRLLLQHKHAAAGQLDLWAERLANESKSTHRVPAKTIRRWMAHWKHDLTVQEILEHEN